MIDVNYPPTTIIPNRASLLVYSGFRRYPITIIEISLFQINLFITIYTMVKLYSVPNFDKPKCRKITHYSNVIRTFFTI